MNIYVKRQIHETEKVLDEDIQFMANKLLNFVMFYKQFILIETQEDLDKINLLSELAVKMKNREYDKLFCDTSIVSFKTPQELFGYILDDPEYPF